MSEQRRLSVREAAERAGVSQKVIRRRITAGALPGYRVSGTTKIVVLEHELDTAFSLERIAPAENPPRPPAPRPSRSRRAAARGSRASLRAIEAERGA